MPDICTLLAIFPVRNHIFDSFLPLPVTLPSGAPLRLNVEEILEHQILWTGEGQSLKFEVSTTFLKRQFQPSMIL
jgi:hypothetical protein